VAKKGFTQPARGAHEPIRMEDLRDWIVEIEGGYSKIVRLSMLLCSIGPKEEWTLSVAAYESSMEPSRAPFCEVRTRWPNRGQKTVLGALLYLVIKLEQELAAHYALEDLSSTPHQT